MAHTIFLRSKLLFVGFILLLFQQAHTQIVIGTPDLNFSQACANESFNSFSTQFIFNPEEGVGASNQFIIEMSDASGDFTEAETVFTSDPGAITSSPAQVEFSIPVDTGGDAYKIRVRSTDPVAMSPASDSFTAYYKIQDSPFTINDLEGTAVFCPGGSYLLTIDNPGTGNNDSPLNYPSLTYNWYKETGPTTSVLVGQDPTLSVNQEGVYFVETNYGSCTSDSFSNRVTVMEATSGEGADAPITSSLGNSFCGGDDFTTLETIDGESYKWYRNGSLISGATQQTYETNLSGTYSVRVFFGECEATGSIELQAGDFDSSLNVPYSNEIETGSSLNIIVTTEALDPEYVWMLDGEIIPMADQSSLTVSEFGTYQVMITQTVNCVMTKELNFEVTQFIDPFPDVSEVPNIVSPNGDGINDTWILPAEYVTGSETNIQIISRNGEIVLETNDYMNNWPENMPTSSTVNIIYYYIITPIDQPQIKGTITLLN
ncbi:MAG: gliding motility-associated C-terminal domain-containing protein [Flavobacteriaceae bacterium]|nr:gliding motility-associated C-terminal domain-containing protein [Flavobacteriaceae bacterium]